MPRSRKAGWLWEFFLLFLMSVLLLTGCVPARQAGSREFRSVTDYTNTEVRVPVHPERVVSLGVSTDDILVPVLGPERIAAIADLPPNYPEEAARIKGRVSMSTESVMACQPDLVVAADWASPDFIQELRTLDIPVYVYRTPTTWEGAVARIYELSGVVNEPEKGARLAEDSIGRMERLKSFLSSIPREKRLIAAYDTTLGFSGGAGSTFDELCRGAWLRNGLAEAGLGANDTASREMALKVDPQIIFIPSDAYDKGTYKALTESQIYSDPALSGMNAVKNKKVFVIDARWIMSTSQFMVRAMEEMAADAYGYKPEA